MERAKITILGDMMCEPRLLQNARTTSGAYDFHPVFCHMKDFLAESDYIIGNLETPIAGEAAGYTSGYFSFNTPAEFVDAIHDVGINLVSTMNNHCLDRGFEGMENTLRVLDEKGLNHTGTYCQLSNEPRFFTFTVGKAKVALVAFGAHTNYNLNHVVLSQEQERALNLLRPQAERLTSIKPKGKNIGVAVVNRLFFYLNAEQRYAIKKKLGLIHPAPIFDTEFDKNSAAPYIKQMQETIRLAKNHADLVLFYPHLLGQFNPEPSAFSQYAVKMAVEAGADMVIGSHPHIVQKAERIEGVPCFYSIGNFSMSPNSVYLLHENLPEYGLAVHLYLEKHAITDISFSVLKIVEPKKKHLSVYPVSVLAGMLGSETERSTLRRDVARIYSTVTGKTTGEEFSIQNEYSVLV